MIITKATKNQGEQKTIDKNPRFFKHSSTYLDLSGKDVLITGGLGFIGSNLAHKLIDMKANVTVYDAFLPEFGANPANIEEIKHKIRVIRGDIRSRQSLSKHTKDADIIFHCAAQLSRVYSMSDPWIDMKINCIGTINILEAVRKYSPATKVVFTSSRAVIGVPAYLPADENTPTRPVDNYGADKLTAENYCLIYHRLYGVRSSVVRLNNCYGPRGQMKNGNYMVINLFIKQALSDDELTVFEPGTQVRDYNYVDDVTEALIKAATLDAAVGEVLMLGSGQPISLIDLAKLIVKIAGSGKVTVVPPKQEWKSIEIGDFYVNFKKAQNILGWQPKVDIETGLGKTIEFYKERLSKYL